MRYSVPVLKVSTHYSQTPKYDSYVIRLKTKSYQESSCFLFLTLLVLTDLLETYNNVFQLDLLCPVLLRRRQDTMTNSLFYNNQKHIMYHKIVEFF